MDSTDDEKNKKVSTKKSKGVVTSVKTFYKKNKVLVIILLVILIVAGGFGVYAFMNRKTLGDDMDKTLSRTNKAWDDSKESAEKTIRTLHEKLKSSQGSSQKVPEGTKRGGNYDAERSFAFF